jgi:hypothetical protein
MMADGRHALTGIMTCRSSPNLSSGTSGKVPQISKSVRFRPVSLGKPHGLVEGGAQLATAE